MMKIIIRITIAIFTLITLSSCEDVVDIDLDTANPKLVIDASIKWQKGTSGNEQIIRLTTTTNFYDSTIPNATGATVTVFDGTTTYDFIEDVGTGNYICTNFNPVINGTYTLTVIYKGEVYTATDTLYPTPEIETVTQSVISGLGNQEAIEIKYFFQDNGLEDNYYLLGVKNSNNAFPEFGASDDEFFQGNQMFGLYIDDELEVNDVLELSVQGISVRYFNYMEKLLNIAGNDGGNPFSSPPATLRGNITNQTNTDNFPFGYFSLGEIDTENYIVQ